MRLLNLTKVCDILGNYYTTAGIVDSSDIRATCQGQKSLYIIWILVECLIIGIKIFSIYFGYRAHLIVKKQIKIRKKIKKQ
jgi:hypothetical protein